MGNNAVICPWIRSMSKCVLNVVSQTVKKFQYRLEEVGCNVVGGLYEQLCYVIMFKGLLHHLFVELVKPVSAVIARE